MGALNNIKVGKKIIGSFIIIIALLLLISVSSFVSMKDINHDMTMMYADQLVPISHLGQVDAAFYKLRGDVYKFIMLPDERAKIGQEIGVQIGVVEKNMKGFHATDHNKEEKDEIVRFDRTWSNFQKIVAEVLELSKNGKEKDAIKFIATGGTFSKARTELADSLDKLIEINVNLAEKTNKQGDATFASVTLLMVVVSAIALILALVIGIVLTRSMANPLATITKAAQQVSSGDLSAIIQADQRSDEIGVLTKAFREMLENLRNTTMDLNEGKRLEEQLKSQDWMKSGIVRLNQVMGGDPDLNTIASRAISEIATYLDAQVGVIYLTDDKDSSSLSLMGSYAYSKRKNLSNVFRPGEGLVGQAALEKKQILIQNVPDDYIKVTSGLGERVPRFICVTPFLYEGATKGVVEIGTLNEMTDREMEYLNQAMPALAVSVQSASDRMAVARLLMEAQALSEELQAQQEELRTTNEELEEQTNSLKVSEEELKTQQEELQVTNEELQEKNQLLDRQKRDVEKARNDIETQAEELALASKYKSEFLANMSHELRTPLNSLLLLAQSLSENKSGNLTGEQVECATIIRSSGSDLLSLINEILDLSKIEAGRMDLKLDTVRMSDLADSIRSSFGHMAENKGINLEVTVREGAPSEIRSDQKRIEQVLKNLMSNAIKFTDSGSITVSFARTATGTNLMKSGLSAGESMAIEVRDTGIGIAPQNQKIIFEAFQQVDGGTARKYGGTGLGLSISRELARLLGGEIQIESQPGKGSTFTLYLPVDAPSGRSDSPRNRTTVTVARDDNNAAPNSGTRQNSAIVQIEDDRGNLEKDDRLILVIEDDPAFARILHGKCNEKGFKCLAAPTGEAGFELALKYLPGAIILDLNLPGMDGWAVLRALKENTGTRHIPVHIVSADGTKTEAFRNGAVGLVNKPLTQEDLEETFQRFERVSSGKLRRILVIDDDPVIRRETVKLLLDKDVKVDEAENALQAMEALRSGGYDCMVLDLGLPDMDGDEMLKRLEREGVDLPPVIVYTAQDLTANQETDLREHAESVVIKDVRSQERLLDEVSLFLHRVVSEMPKKKRQIIMDLHNTEALLLDKKVLVVDDDMRTTFALSRLLSERGMKPVKAENGMRALKMLEEQPDVDIVLMDIMMPLMDGYEAMKRIREQEKFRKLPIIALTAKAMPEDRQKCLAAGANDYLRKPVDQNLLFSMMRVWLYR